MGQMMGFGAGIWMLLWWLIGLGVLFFVIYEAVYLAMGRALRENRMAPSQQQPPPEQPPPPAGS